MTITEAIFRIRQDWSESPAEINDGDCEEFAQRLIERGFGNLYWGDELYQTDWSPAVRDLPDWMSHFAPGHCFVEYQECYYDAECPKGVKWPDQLPYYKRDRQFIRAGAARPPA